MQNKLQLFIVESNPYKAFSSIHPYLFSYVVPMITSNLKVQSLKCYIIQIRKELFWVGGRLYLIVLQLWQYCAKYLNRSLPTIPCDTKLNILGFYLWTFNTRAVKIISWQTLKGQEARSFFVQTHRECKGESEAFY